MGQQNILRTLRADFQAIFNHQAQTLTGASSFTPRGKIVALLAFSLGPILLALIVGVDFVKTYELIIITIFYYVALHALVLNWAR